jgi:outer membrane protein TolC
MSHKNVLTVALLMSLAAFGAQAQLSIEECHDKTKANYPLARQYALIAKSKELDIALARRGYLPRLSLSGKSTYQSDVTTMNGRELATKDQYAALAELSQTIWDGGIIGAQIDGIEASSLVERRKLDVDLYALNDRVDQLFFGVLAVRAQLEQNTILTADLEASRKRVETGIANGVASKSDLDAVRIEILNARQRAIEFAATETAYRESLSALIGEEIPESIDFAMPDTALAGQDPEKRSDVAAAIRGSFVAASARRPELALFEAQAAQCETQKEAVRASKHPKLSAFAQGAYGKPGLNMLDSDATTYWIAGLRLSWSLNGLIDTRDEIAKLDARSESIEAQKEAFLLNNGMQADRIRTDIERLRGLLSGDDEIIALREGLRDVTDAKLGNGAATTDDLLKAIDAVDLARQGRALHEVQLAAAIYALKNSTNE